jgi:ankyrin repeat protein
LPLRRAAEGGREACVRELLAAGASPRAQNSMAVPIAVRGGHEGCVMVLLAAGADPAPQGGQALLEAAYRGQDGCLRALLEAGAMARRPDMCRSALWFAAE